MMEGEVAQAAKNHCKIKAVFVSKYGAYFGAQSPFDKSSEVTPRLTAHSTPQRQYGV